MNGTWSLKFLGLVVSCVILALAIVFAPVVLWGDTTHVPLRGYGPVETNGGAVLYSGPRVVPRMSIPMVLPLPLPTNVQVTLAIPLTNGLRMSIEKTIQAGPPMPPVKTHARLRWIHDDYYGVECEQTDILFTANEPIVERTKGGWRIRWK